MGRKFRNSKVVGTKNWRLGSLWGHWHSAAFLVCALLHIVQHMALVHGCLISILGLHTGVYVLVL